STATDTPMVEARTTTEASKGTTDAARSGQQLDSGAGPHESGTRRPPATIGRVLPVWIYTRGDHPCRRWAGAAAWRTHASRHRRRPVAAAPRPPLGGQGQYRPVGDYVSSNRARLQQAALAARANWRRHLRRPDSTGKQAGHTVACTRSAVVTAHYSSELRWDVTRRNFLKLAATTG